MNGFVVFVDSSKDGEYFSDAASAMRYAAFMEQLGCDAIFYNARMVEGRVVREERVPEQFMRACVNLGL